MQILNVSKGIVIARQAQIASSLSQRMKGLLGRDRLEPDEALILKPCTSIHTFFMRFAIDVLFLDNQMRVIKACHKLLPFRLSPLVWASQMAVELPAGKIDQTNTQPGDVLKLSV